MLTLRARVHVAPVPRAPFSPPHLISVSLDVRALTVGLFSAAIVGIAPAVAQKTGTAKPQRDQPAHRQKAVSRSGVAIVDVDFASGKVVRVRMLKSTGNGILDHAVVRGFLKYRFKPKTIRQPMQIPITFTVTGAEI